MSEETFSGWINPLNILGRNESIPTTILSDDKSTSSYILHRLYGTGGDIVGNVSNEIEARILRITDLTAEFQIPIIPNELKIMEKLIWPLKSAKAAYCLKHNLECILLCGIVSEMLVLLIYKMLPEKLLEKLDNKYANRSNNFQFKNYSHYSVSRDKRIRQLTIAIKSDDLLEVGDKVTMSLLDKLKTGKFLFDINFIREKRNQYIHSFEMEYLSIEEDSELVYTSAQRSLKHIFDFNCENGGLIFPLYLDEYCKLKGIINATSQI